MKEKKSALEVAQAKLEAAKADQSKVEAAHKELVSAYRAYLAAQKEAEHQEKLAAQKASIEQAGGNPIPVVQNGKIVEYVQRIISVLKVWVSLLRISLELWG